MFRTSKFLNTLFCTALLGTMCCGTCLAVNRKGGGDANYSGGWYGGADEITNEDFKYKLNQNYLLSGTASPDGFVTNSSGGQSTIVVAMARKFNDRGGYFCTTPIRPKATNTHGAGVSIRFLKRKQDRCKWLCKDGYKGENCQYTDDAQSTDETELRSFFKGSPDFTSDVTDNIDVFALYDDGNWSGQPHDKGYAEILMVMKYLEHGVMVGHTWIYAWSPASFRILPVNSRPTFIYKIHGSGKAFLLCAEGYQANSSKTDCELMPNAPKPLCSGWTEAEYRAHESDLIYTEVNGCRQYRCSDTTKAFPSATNRICEPCSVSGVRGAPDKNGVCKTCAIGQYFDQASDQCKTATMLHKSDLQYGQGNSRGSAPKNVLEQCWTQTSASDYKMCVFNETPPATTDGSATQPRSALQLQQQKEILKEAAANVDKVVKDAELSL